MILAVALSIGVRRVLSRENIYTIKLSALPSDPKALHANMFLVRHDRAHDKRARSAGRDGLRSSWVRPSTSGALKHVVVIRNNRIFGVLRVNTALRRGLEDAFTGVTLGDVAQRDFTIAREDDVAFDVIERMWRKGGTMAVVVAGKGVPTAGRRQRHHLEGTRGRFGRRQHQRLCLTTRGYAATTATTTKPSTGTPFSLRTEVLARCRATSPFAARAART